MRKRAITGQTIGNFKTNSMGKLEERAAYIAEGQRRSRIRKANRYTKFNQKGNGYCTHGRNDWHACPYQEDMNDNHDNHYCRCCSSCRSDCAGDI